MPVGDVVEEVLSAFLHVFLAGYLVVSSIAERFIAEFMVKYKPRLEMHSLW